MDTCRSYVLSRLICVSVAGGCGWQRFFGELESFLTAADREFGSASLGHAQFAVERLEICVHALVNLLAQLEGQPNEDLSEVRTTVVEIKRQLYFMESGRVE